MITTPKFLKVFIPEGNGFKKDLFPIKINIDWKSKEINNYIQETQTKINKEVANLRFSFQIGYFYKPENFSNKTQIKMFNNGSLFELTQAVDYLTLTENEAPINIGQLVIIFLLKNITYDAKEFSEEYWEYDIVEQRNDLYSTECNIISSCSHLNCKALPLNPQNVLKDKYSYSFGSLFLVRNDQEYILDFNEFNLFSLIHKMKYIVNESEIGNIAEMTNLWDERVEDVEFNESLYLPLKTTNSILKVEIKKDIQFDQYEKVELINITKEKEIDEELDRNDIDNFFIINSLLKDPSIMVKGDTLKLYFNPYFFSYGTRFTKTKKVLVTTRKANIYLRKLKTFISFFINKISKLVQKKESEVSTNIKIKTFSINTKNDEIISKSLGYYRLEWESSNFLPNEEIIIQITQDSVIKEVRKNVLGFVYSEVITNSYLINLNNLVEGEATLLVYFVSNPSIQIERTINIIA